MVAKSEQALANKAARERAWYKEKLAEEFDCPGCGKKTNQWSYKTHTNSLLHKHIVLQREYLELQEKFSRRQTLQSSEETLP